MLTSRVIHRNVIPVMNMILLLIVSTVEVRQYIFNTFANLFIYTVYISRGRLLDMVTSLQYYRGETCQLEITV